MSGPNDFTNQNIQDTYQRVLQISSSNEVTDGTGSLAPVLQVTSSNALTAITASHALFAVSASHETTFELSSSHALNANNAISSSHTPNALTTMGTGTGNTVTVTQFDGTQFTRTIDNVISSSYALTSSYSETASFVEGLSGNNSGDVTLTGTPEYITISGQEITRNQIDLANDVTGILPDANLSTNTAHLDTTQTFTGNKTFSGALTASSGLTVAGNISASGDGLFNNVGIGTTSPEEKLTVKDGYIAVTGSSTSHGYKLHRGGYDSYSLRHLDGGLTIYNIDDNEKEMTFDGTGNVGIGNDDPTEKLTVSGNISASGVGYFDSLNITQDTVIGGDIDLEGSIDVNGTLEADAITLNGTSLSDVIVGTTVTNATNATNVVVTNDTGTQMHPVVFIDDTSPNGGNESLKANTDIKINPSAGQLNATSLSSASGSFNYLFGGPGDMQFHAPSVLKSAHNMRMEPQGYFYTHFVTPVEFIGGTLLSTGRSSQAAMTPNRTTVSSYDASEVLYHQFVIPSGMTVTKVGVWASAGTYDVKSAFIGNAGFQQTHLTAESVSTDILQDGTAAEGSAYVGTNLTAPPSASAGNYAGHSNAIYGVGQYITILWSPGAVGTLHGASITMIPSTT